MAEETGTTVGSYYRSLPTLAARETWRLLGGHLKVELALVVSTFAVAFLTGGFAAALLSLAVIGALLALTFVVNLVRAPVLRERGMQRALDRAESERDAAQGRLREIATPSFDCNALLERLPWEVVVNGVHYVHDAVAWVEVENEGPTSEFTARVPEVSGVPEDWGPRYKVIQPAWERETFIHDED